MICRFPFISSRKVHPTAHATGTQWGKEYSMQPISLLKWRRKRWPNPYWIHSWMAPSSTIPNRHRMVRRTMRTLGWDCGRRSLLCRFGGTPHQTWKHLGPRAQQLRSERPHESARRVPRSDSLVSDGKCEHHTKPTNTTHSRTFFSLGSRRVTESRIVVSQRALAVASFHTWELPKISHAVHSDLLQNHLPDLYRYLLLKENYPAQIHRLCLSVFLLKRTRLFKAYQTRPTALHL